MRKQPYYFYSLLFVFIIPTFIFGSLVIKEVSISTLFIFALIVMVIGAIWDTWATKHGFRDKFWLWKFNDKYMLGPKVFGIPIEEYLFFFFAPTFTMTFWELLVRWQNFPNVKNMLVFLVVVLWLFTATLLPKLKQPN